MRAAIILAMMLLPGSAAAEPESFPPLPPAEYQDSPEPAIVMWGSPAAVNLVCRDAARVTNPNIVVIACTSRERRVQIMPNPCLFPGEYYARLACHENGHLNGWVHEPPPEQ